MTKLFSKNFKEMFNITKDDVVSMVGALVVLLIFGFFATKYEDNIKAFKNNTLCSIGLKDMCRQPLWEIDEESGFKPDENVTQIAKRQGIGLTDYNISTTDINNDGVGEMIIEDQSASWWRTTFVLTLEKELDQSGESYNFKLTPFCKTCKFSYWNGHVEFKDLDGNGSKEAIVTGGIEKGGESTGKIEYREEIYYFKNGDYAKKGSRIVEPQK